MDFKWVVDALRRGLKVTRKAWAGDPPMYLYVLKEENGEKAIMRHSGTEQDSKWYPRPELILDTTDWEEYVEPKVRQEGPFVINPLPLTGTMGMHGGKSVEDSDIEEDTGYVAKLAGMLADSCAEKISQRVVQLLQKTDVPLSKEDTNHACTVYHRRRS